MHQGTIKEENLRAKILLPFLSALGISMDQIDIERTLRLRLGRTVHEYKSDEITGRLDVLVRSRTGENLFVVELKREGSTLTDADRDQGISYARLLDNIAPFVLVTNGEESHLYDSISREEIKCPFGKQAQSDEGGVARQNSICRVDS